MVAAVLALAAAVASVDWVVTLVAMGATLRLLSPSGERELALQDFMQAAYTTALQDDELITAVRFARPQRAAYAKFRQPASRFAMLGVFVAKTASGARVAITGGGNGIGEAVAKHLVRHGGRVALVGGFVLAF